MHKQNAICVKYVNVPIIIILILIIIIMWKSDVNS
jgi:hypothetical protein